MMRLPGKLTCLGTLLLILAASGCAAPPALVEPTRAVEPVGEATPAATGVFEPAVTLAASATPDAASAANADVEFVRAVRNSDETWTFHVTVRHPDTGWDDYADGWNVVLPGGAVVKPDPDSSFTRLLLHPHETEQPFTRSQSGIVVPTDVTTVTVRAHDLVDGWGGREVVVDLSAASGPDFEVQR